ncbi:hypothetical protein PA905_34150 [Planktothrix agardhii CCAP 1459/11A]|uniref:Uncharacterized protein n=1 Tax=Planktothrix agardhii CCAP 1459/11A TaxID=282420 RepID=A0A4P5ZGA2_PLAAG|nr:tetratricopeptide repeat protein [Planktothrix agardhii]GDZ95176.1 hypothetical protein PA905_34150 [Planktothrix agardhii CCAP 1459/11A]
MNHANNYGIDCGTTNWRIFQFNGSDPSQVPQPLSLTIFDSARHCLPTALLLDENQKILACGERAYEEITNYDLYKSANLFDAFKLCFGNDQTVEASDPNKRYTHQEALSHTGKLLSKVVERLQEEKPNCLATNNQFIFTHPVHWGITKSNGEIEGKILGDFALTIQGYFPENLHNNIRFLPEPEAALLSLLQTKQLQQLTNGYTLIVDIGGGTTDVVAGQLTSGGLEDIRYFGKGYGGNHFDEAIAQYIAIQFELNESQQLSLDRQLRYYGRKFKENLSQQARINYNQAVNFQVLLADPTEKNVLRRPISLTCTEFEQIVTKGKEYLHDSLLVALEKMQLTPENIGQIILVGGGARLFIVPNILREMFGNSVPIIYGDPPESTVARGAALWGMPKQLLNIPLLSKPKKEGDEYAKIARENLRQQKYQQAIEGFTEVIQENPTNVPAYFNRGQARYQKGDIQGAINDWSQVVTMNPNDAYASYQLGVALLQQEDYQAAVMNFNQALSLNPQLADAYLERGIAKYYLGQQEQAIKDFNQAINISPGIAKNRLQDLKNPLKNMGSFLFNQGKKKRLEGLVQTLEYLLGYKEPKTPIDSFLDLIQTKLPQEPEVISVMTYKAVVEFFVTERPSFPEIQKGAILRQKYPKKQGLFVVYQVFLDGKSELVCRQDNGIPFGRKVLVKNFDEELSDSFQNKDLLIFE